MSGKKKWNYDENCNILMEKFSIRIYLKNVILHFMLTEVYWLKEINNNKWKIK